MPTYEYACKSCGEHVEAVQSFTDAPLTECPTCDGPLRKVFGTPGIVLKGSGFYKTDSRAANGKARGDRAKSADGTTSESAQGSSTNEGASTGSGDAGPDTASKAGSTSAGSNAAANGHGSSSEPSKSGASTS